MLKVEHISKSFGTLKAVDDLSFTLKEGEILGILGSSKAGKTTTLKLVSSLIDADKGKITFDSKKIDDDIAKKIGFLSDEMSLFSDNTVKDEIIYHGKLKGMSEGRILSRLNDLLSYFKMNNYYNMRIKDLSKIDMKKVKFILSIVNKPNLLILDDVFTDVDPVSIKMIKDVILALKKRGCIIIFSSNQVEHIEYFAGKVIVLKKGKSILEGYIKDIKKLYKSRNIIIKADVKTNVIRKISGVIDVIKMSDYIVVKVKDESIVDEVYKAVKINKLEKFNVEDVSLNEILIDKVGQLL